MIKRLRSIIALIGALRHSPKSGVRIAWWSVAVLLAAIMANSPSCFILWVICNVSLSLVSTCWGAFHPRVIWKGHQTSLRWAFGLSLFAGLQLFANADALFGLAGVRIPANAITLLVLVTLPFLFAGIWGTGLFGAALAAFTYRKRRDVDRDLVARLGVTSFWLSLATSLFLIYLTDQGFLHLGFLSEQIAALLFASLPALTFGMTALLRRATGGSRPFLKRLTRALSQRLIWRIKRRGRVRQLDMRGPALGVLAALITLMANDAHLLLPLQTSTLASILRLRGSTRSASDSGSKQVVLLEMDAATRRAILTDTSESKVQADIIAQLASYGAARIVLPAPTVSAPMSDSLRRSRRRSVRVRVREAVEEDEEPTKPLPVNTPEMERAKRDLPALQSAMHQAGNVLLARRLNAGKVSAEEAQMQSAALATVSSELPVFGMGRMPQIPARWNASPPLPVQLFAAVKRRAPTWQPVAEQTDLEQVAGKTVPLAARNLILADFDSAETGRQLLPHISYTDVMEKGLLPSRPNALQQPISDGKTEWIAPEVFFKDKIVFLDALERDEQETYLGNMPCMEALARTTDALFTGHLVSRINPFALALLTLFLGAYTGTIGARRNPLEAGWRMALPIFLITLIAFFSLLAARRWLDPVAPTVAVGMTFLLVTQLTYALVSDERERNRGLLRRFVAPQVLEELLDDPESLGLGGTKQEVCVLFADVRNFTGFAESRDPQEVVEVINEYMTGLRQALFAHDGILDKYTGDGLMALFRVTSEPDPERKREDVKRSVLAALEMQEAALAISRRRQEEGKTPLQIGISLHYGEAVVGLVGDPEQFNYTALGHTVVVSARLQTLAAGGEVVISDAVYRMTHESFIAEAGAPVHVKGISAPVFPYRIRGIGALEPPKPTTPVATSGESAPQAILRNQSGE